jgi:hypothetical protein
MRELPGLPGHGLHPLRMSVPDLRDRDPAEEVEVLVSLGIPQSATIATHELDRVPRVRAHHVLALERLELF